MKQKKFWYTKRKCNFFKFYLLLLREIIDKLGIIVLEQIR